MKSFDYDATDIHLAYNKGREFPPEVIIQWMDVLARHLAPDSVHTVVDVGCGTGRFTAPLADRFAATVYGIDSSRKMLSVAREAPVHPGIILLEGSAEQLPLGDGLADLIFLSMVYHHIQDKSLACREFRRVLKPGGSLCLRIVMRGRLLLFPWLLFFPEALAIEMQRVPSAQELTALLGEAGLALNTHEIVRQEFARDPNDYAEKIGQRSLSSLKAIPDDAFERGLARLREHCQSQPDSPVYEDIELFIFNRS